MTPALRTGADFADTPIVTLTALVHAERATVDVLSRAAGLDLRAYRPEHVAERVRRALEREGVDGEEALACLLRRDAEARSRFRRSVAVSVSGLFRDRQQFDLLARELLPPLLARTNRVRVWSAGCADGSELYSVAMLLDRRGALDRSSLLGSDVLEENLEAARRGTYGDLTVPRGLRARVRFECRDLVRESPPPGKWNLVLCRNVAIYLAPAAKQSLYAALAASLALGGVLLLGRSERFSDPNACGLRPVGPHAYARTA